MKIYISYFYQIRFFSPNMIPISTAMWDPKWYSNNAPYVDKNGVINGYRAPILNFPNDEWEKLQQQGAECRKNCPFSPPCLFMTKYKEYLDTLNFEQFMNDLKIFGEQLGILDPIFVLIVHEKPSCVCAERPVLQQWFKEHGIELKEWNKNELL